MFGSFDDHNPTNKQFLVRGEQTERYQEGKKHIYKSYEEAQKFKDLRANSELKMITLLKTSDNGHSAEMRRSVMEKKNGAPSEVGLLLMVTSRHGAYEHYGNASIAAVGFFSFQGAFVPYKTANYIAVPDASLPIKKGADSSHQRLNFTTGVMHCSDCFEATTSDLMCTEGQRGLIVRVSERRLLARCLLAPLRSDHGSARSWCTFDKARDLYIYPAGELLRTTGSASVHDAKAMDYLIHETTARSTATCVCECMMIGPSCQRLQRCEMHVVNGIEIH